MTDKLPVVGKRYRATEANKLILNKDYIMSCDEVLSDRVILDKGERGDHISFPIEDFFKYLEEVPKEQSRWQGDCYVFDRRMAVGHSLTTGHYNMCFCCGYPLSAKDKTHDLYEEGVSCAYCYEKTSDKNKSNYRMRHKQLMTPQK
jgi:hypothetical protein